MKRRVPTHPKSPIRHHGGPADDLRILRRHRRGRRTGEKVQIDDAAERIVLEIGSCAVAAGAHVHAVAVEEEDAVGALVAAVVEVDGMVSIASP